MTKKVGESGSMEKDSGPKVSDATNRAQIEASSSTLRNAVSQQRKGKGREVR